MFAQMIKFQMESQQKNEEKIFKNEEKLLQLQKENKEIILKNEEKKNSSSLNYKNDEKNFLKVEVITCLQIVLLFSLKMQCGTHSKHFPTHQMSIRPLRHITKGMTISILPAVPIGLMQKSPATSTKARDCGRQKGRRLYLTKKKLANLAF